MKPNFIHTYVSVDCVVFGFDDNQLNILLVQKNIEDSTHQMKLPGSLIFNNEDVDDAASRVLHELTGIKRMSLRQFRCFASPNRANNPLDVNWLDKEYKPDIDRLITVAYLALCKIDRKLNNNISKYSSIEWCPISQVPKLPFDHNEIVEKSLVEIRRWIEYDPAIVFDLLPHKFTINQLHKLYEAIYSKKIDIRNFHKKVAAMPYVIALDEKQKGVSHRAARYYKFEKKAYNKLKASI